MRCGCALLAGGRGSRMGWVNKAELKYEGQTFADRIAAEMESTGMPCYISSATYEQKTPYGWALVKDEITDSKGNYIGPMGGVFSCLRRAEGDGLDGLFFAPCDAPLFRREIIDKLLMLINNDIDCVCWRTLDGRLQTTFGWYSVKMIPILEEEIQSDHFKLLKSMEKCRAATADAHRFGIDENAFVNINTEEDYRQQSLQMRHNS